MRIDSERMLGELRRHGMTQHDLAQAAGVGDVSICRYINGERTPRSDVIVRLANALNVSTGYLMGFDMKPEEAYADTRSAILSNGPMWSGEQVTELLKLLVGFM